MPKIISWFKKKKRITSEIIVRFKVDISEYQIFWGHSRIDSNYCNWKWKNLSSGFIATQMEWACIVQHIYLHNVIHSKKGATKISLWALVVLNLMLMKSWMHQLFFRPHSKRVSEKSPFLSAANWYSNSNSNLNYFLFHCLSWLK